ncbi:MAG: hypothetical protein ABJC09_00260 [Terriglobia bacterium]
MKVRGAAALIAVICGPAQAHVISMSSGQVTIERERLEYILRMPDYEVKGTDNPAGLLFAHISFSSGSAKARLVSDECHHDITAAAWICAANYVFPEPIGQLGVECTFYEATVANHIHVLRAEREGKTDRAILDSAFPSATLTFRPPTAAERAFEQGVAGALRVWTSAAVAVLLFGLAMVSGFGRQLFAAGCVFIASQAAMANFSGTLAPLFAECVAALALVWIAVEVIVAPAAARRWPLTLAFAAIAGSFSGLYFAAFLKSSGYGQVPVLVGAGVASMSVLAISGAVVHILARFTRMRLFVAGALAAGGGAWFAIRLISG